MSETRGPITHDLEAWPVPYADVCRGVKRAELRKDDRDFRIGDYLRLREFDPVKGEYSGRWLMHRITHIVRDSRSGLQPGYAVLSISECMAKGTVLPPVPLERL